MDDPLGDERDVGNEPAHELPDSSSGLEQSSAEVTVEQPDAQMVASSTSPTSSSPPLPTDAYSRLSPKPEMSTTSTITCSALPSSSTTSTTTSSVSHSLPSTLSPSAPSPTSDSLLESSSQSSTIPNETLSLNTTLAVEPDLLPSNDDITDSVSGSGTEVISHENIQDQKETLSEFNLAEESNSILENCPENVTLNNEISQQSSQINSQAAEEIEPIMEYHEIVSNLEVNNSHNNIITEENDENKSDLGSQASVQSSVPTEIINESSQGTIEDSVQEGIDEFNFTNTEIINQPISLDETQSSNAFASVSDSVSEIAVPESSDSQLSEQVQESFTVSNEYERIQDVSQSEPSVSEALVSESLPTQSDIEMEQVLVTSNIETQVEFETMTLEENQSSSNIEIQKTCDETVQQPIQPEAADEAVPEIFNSIKFAICEDVHNIDEIKRVLLAGGAKFLNYLSDSASLLIADNAEHSSVSEAVDIFEKPVVTSQWVWLSLRAKTVLPTTPFSLLNDRAFLSGICASSSQLTRTDRARAWALITYYGGRFQSSLDQNCTHLITNSITGRKYERASAPGSNCRPVTLEWLKECCKAKKICDEVHYNPRLLITFNSGCVALNTDSGKKNKNSVDSSKEELDEESLFSDKTTSSTVKAVKMSISTEACVRQKDAKIVPVKIAKPSIVELKSSDNAIVSPRSKASLNVQTTHNVPTHPNSANVSPRTVPGTMSPRRLPPVGSQPYPTPQPQPNVQLQHSQQNVQVKTQQVQSQPSQELDPTKHFARKSQPQYSQPQPQQQQQQQQQQMFSGQGNVQHPNSMLSPTNTSQQMHPQQIQQHAPQMQQISQQTHPSQQSVQQQHIQMSGRPPQISQIQQGNQQNQVQLLQQRQQLQLQQQQQQRVSMGANLQSQQPQVQPTPHQMQPMQQSPQQQNLQQNPQAIQQQQFQQNPQQHQQFQQQNGSVPQRQVYVSVGGQQDYQSGQQFIVQRPVVSQQQPTPPQMNPQQMNSQPNPQVIQQQAPHQTQPPQQQIYRYPNQQQQQALQNQQQQRFQQNVGMPNQQQIQQQQHMAMNPNVRMQQQQRFAVRPMQQIMQNPQQQVSPQSQQQMAMQQQNQGNYQMRPKFVILPNNDSDGYVGPQPQAQQTTQSGYPIIHIPANLTPEQKQQYIAQRVPLQQQQLQHAQQQHPQQQPIGQQQQISIQQPPSTSSGNFVQNPQMQIQVRQPVQVQQQQQQVILQQQQQQRMMRPSIQQPQQPQQHYQMNQIRPQQMVRQMHTPQQQQQIQYQQQQQQQIQQQRQWQGQEFPGGAQQQHPPQPQPQQAGISVHYNMQQQPQMRTQDGQWIQNPVQHQQQRVLNTPNGPVSSQQLSTQQQPQQLPPQQHPQQVNVGVYQQHLQQQPKMVSSVQLIGPESGTKIKLEPAPPPPVATVVAGESRNLIVMQSQTQQVQQAPQVEQPTLVQVQVQTQPNTSAVSLSQPSQISSQNPNIVHEKTKTALANLLNNRLQNNSSANGSVQATPGTPTTPGAPTGTVVQVTSGVPGTQGQGKLIQLPVQTFQVQQQQQVPPLISQASAQSQQQQQQASLAVQNTASVPPQQQQIVVASSPQIQVQHLGQQSQQQITLLNTNASVPGNAVIGSQFSHKQDANEQHSTQIPMHQRNGFISHGPMQPPPPPYTGQNGVMLQQPSHPQHVVQNQPQHVQQLPQQIHPNAQQQSHPNQQQIVGQKVATPQMIQQPPQQIQLHPNVHQVQHPQPTPIHSQIQPQHSGFQHQQVQLQQPQHLQQAPQSHQTVQLPKTPRQQFVQIRYFGQETKSDPVPSRLCLFGSVFFFGPFYIEKETASKMIPYWRKAIEKYGGKVVDDYTANLKNITHFLTDNMQSLLATTALKDGKRCVSVWWIEDVLSRMHLIPPWRFYHLPMMNCLSLKNQVITTTNFEKKDREKLRMLIKKAGGIYTSYISRQNTLLIAASLRGSKYDLALNYRLPIVNMKWLHDAMLGITETLQLSNLGKRYLTFDSLSPESTNSTTNTSNATSKSLAGDIFGVDYSVVHNLMNSWKVSINYNEEVLKKKHREVLEEDKKEKLRIEEAKKLKAEQEAKAKQIEAAEDKKLLENSTISNPEKNETKVIEIKQEAVEVVSKGNENSPSVSSGVKRTHGEMESVSVPEEGEPSVKRIKIEATDNVEKIPAAVVSEIILQDSNEETTKDADISMQNVKNGDKSISEVDSQATTTVDSVVSEFKVPLPPIISVLLTGFTLEETDKMSEVVLRLGGKLTKLSEECTHLVAPGLQGTMKFLCAYGRAKFVLKSSWILNSSTTGKFLPEDEHNLITKEETEKYGIDFTNIERTPALFKDTVFVMTRSVANTKTLQTVLTANGCFVALRDLPNRNQLNKLFQKELKFVIVSCGTDLHFCKSLVANQYRGLTIPVISPEYIYRAIYMQAFDFEKNNLLESARKKDNEGTKQNLPSSSTNTASLQNQSLLSRLQTSKLPSRPASATAILQRSFSVSSSSTVSPITISGIQHQTLNSVNTISSNLSHQVKPVNHSSLSSFQHHSQQNLSSSLTLNSANVMGSGSSQTPTGLLSSSQSTVNNKAPSMMAAHSKPQAGNRLLVLPS